MSLFHNLDDFEPAARRRLPKAIGDFIAAAAEDGRTRERNRAAFGGWQLVPRVLVDTQSRSLRCEALGASWSAPFGIAPMGATGVAAFRADLVLARAAHKAGIPFMLSGSSLVSLERVVAENPATWFQMYASAEPEPNAALLARLRAAGVQVLVVTVDVPVGGNRETDARNGYASPLRPSARLLLDAALHPRWLLGTFGRTLLHEGVPHFENFAAGRAPMFALRAGKPRSHRRDNLAWDWLAAVRDTWPGKLVLKGVLDPQDAVRAAALGADAIVVSNHGGRQLDGAPASIEMLAGVHAQRGTMEVYCDSGVRRGTDVLKAVGLGASLAFVGRPFLFAAAAAGEAGVDRAIALLRAEIDRDLALLGCKGLAEVAGRIRPA